MEIILGKTAGFCYGVKRAVDGVKEELNDKKNVYCLGEIVHNKSVVDNFKKRGTFFIDSPSEAEGTVIIRAHGITKQIYKELEDKKLEIKDLTCPNVLKIHKIAEEYAQKGYFIILIGEKKHPETIGTASFCGEKSIVLEKEEEIENVLNKIEKSDNILIIAQTTYNSEKFDNLVDILKTKNPTKKIEVRKTICEATRIRQKETENISKNVDLMIIIGGKKSSNTTKLYDISKNNCPKVYFIQNCDEVENIDFNGVEKVGIMAGASTPDEDIKDVVNKIKFKERN